MDRAVKANIIILFIAISVLIIFIAVDLEKIKYVKELKETISKDGDVCCNMYVTGNIRAMCSLIEYRYVKPVINQTTLFP